MSTRAVPYHCPYCGDENLFPHEGEEASQSGWECRSCLRAFKVSMIKQLPRPALGSARSGGTS
jgi:transposase-like protein